MRKKVGVILSFLIALIAYGEERKVFVAEIDGPINPAVQEYLANVIERAERENAELALILMDTPGGLDESMRKIIKDIENSSVPVAVFVYPPGARAASAGAIIALSAHVVIMAPGTNIGAAHPVMMGGEKMDEEMKKKVVNDAIAFAKSLARKHGRSEVWAEKVVKESISYTADEALKEKVIEFVAKNPEECLEKLDGYKVNTVVGEKVLKTKGAKIIKMEMGWREKLLNTFSNPNIAYILLMIGMWGIFFELSHPGAIFPGVVGAICLILGLYSLHTLPVNFAGVALILLGLILFFAEIKLPSYGMLALGGVISILLGTIMLFKSSPPYYRVSLHVVLPLFLFTILFFGTLAYIAIKAQFQKPFVGIEALIGEEGEAVTDIDPEGKVFVHGEYWDAHSDTPIKKGERVKVENIKKFKVIVKKVT
jgi:membrane-bound serine protease (ClpP class)